MLELRNITFSYDGKHLLEDVSLRLPAGETLALLGPSGSGKTSLLRIIAGLEQAESGEVYWEGLPLRGVPPDRRQFGLVFQDYALFPHLDVAGNIGFGLRMRGASRSEIGRAVSETLQLINLPGWERRRIDSLSGGEQQRVALGRALATRPRLLMLDEPLSALDRVLREELAGEIRRILFQTRVPAIYVTHDQEEAFTIATRVAILHQGRILQEGTPDEISAHPANAWIAEFIGLGTVIQGTVTISRLRRVKTELGQFALQGRGVDLAAGQNVELLLRPEGGQVRLTPQRGGPWKAGTVQNIRSRGTGYRLFISIAKTTVVACDVTQALPIGTRVWWHPGKVQYLGK